MNVLNFAMNGLRNDSKKVFQLILREGPITKNELMHKLDIKSTTLNRFIHSLEMVNLIEEKGEGESSGGRKPKKYGVKEDFCYLLGIDISRTYIQVVIANLSMDILFKTRVDMTEGFTPTYTVHIIHKIVTEAVINLNIPLKKVIAIGVGVVGPIDREKGIIKNPVGFPSDTWCNVPIKAMILEAFDIPVFIDNGADMAVFAEYFYGNGRGKGNITYVNCGVGIRTAAISGNQIIRTINDTEDAFGHMVIDVGGELCTCGNRGCIECYTSIASIRKNFILELQKERQNEKYGDLEIKAYREAKEISEIDYREIILLAEQGNEIAVKVIKKAAFILGKGLVNYINLLNPEVVILSGPMIINSPLFYNSCVFVAMEENYLKGKKNIYFLKGGRFGEDAISIGAATRALEESIKGKE